MQNISINGHVARLISIPRWKPRVTTRGRSGSSSSRYILGGATVQVYRVKYGLLSWPNGHACQGDDHRWYFGCYLSCILFYINNRELLFFSFLQAQHNLGPGILKMGGGRKGLLERSWSLWRRTSFYLYNMTMENKSGTTTITTILLSV